MYKECLNKRAACLFSRFRLGSLSDNAATVREAFLFRGGDAEAERRVL